MTIYNTNILFFKYNERYVIGVPSIMQENEREYASKFGFEATIKGCDYRKTNTEKMYWITYLN